LKDVTISGKYVLLQWNPLDSVNRPDDYSYDLWRLSLQECVKISLPDCDLFFNLLYPPDEDNWMQMELDGGLLCTWLLDQTQKLQYLVAVVHFDYRNRGYRTKCKDTVFSRFSELRHSL